MTTIAPVILTDISLFQVGADTYDNINSVTIKVNSPKIKYLRSNAQTYASKKQRTYLEGPVIEVDVDTEDMGNVLSLIALNESDVIINGKVFGSATDAVLTITGALFEGGSQNIKGAGNSDSNSGLRCVATSVDGEAVPYTFVT